MQNYTQQYYQPPYPQYQPPFPQPPVISAEESYRRTLRKDANRAGRLLIYFFAGEIIFSLVVNTLIQVLGLSGLYSSDSMLELLVSNLFTATIFFIISLVFVLVHGLSFARLFPFDRIKVSDCVKLVVIGLLLNLMSNYVVDLVSGTFSLFGIENSGGTSDVGSTPPAFMYLLSIAVVPALIEEFAFRGVIMGILRPYSESLALLVSSATFALMHGNFVQMPFTFCCGLVFGFIVLKTNSLLPGILVHLLNNALSAGTELLVDYEILSAAGVNLLYCAIILILGVLSFFFIKSYIKRGDSFFTLKGANDVIPFRRKMGTVASSPTLITYAAIMLLYSVFVLFS